MTPATIAGMCKLSGLDAAALTDHNTCGNCTAFCQAAEAYGLLALPGMELCTREEVHIVCVFPDLERAGAFQEEVYRSLGEARNDPAIFGRQLYLDADDRVLGEEPRLLAGATAIGVYEVPALVERYGGAAWPAHIDRSSFSLLSDLSCRAGAGGPRPVPGGSAGLAAPGRRVKEPAAQPERPGPAWRSPSGTGEVTVTDALRDGCIFFAGEVGN